MLKSKICTFEQLDGREFRSWKKEIKEPLNASHRKIWEYCYIAQALSERGLLKPGIKGLGFAVGNEPLVSLFAKYGCKITATDIGLEAAKLGGWADTGQHCSDISGLNSADICPHGIFRENASFREVDMNDIPSDLKNFDFCWSCCALEHLGSIRKGMDFVMRAMECLKPGGYAVHTTEFNVSSNNRTVDNNKDVLFRKKDLIQLAKDLTSEGHKIELTFDHGKTPNDMHIDEYPFSDIHIKVRYKDFVLTSYGLIIRKA